MQSDLESGEGISGYVNPRDLAAAKRGSSASAVRVLVNLVLSNRCPFSLAICD